MAWLLTIAKRNCIDHHRRRACVSVTDNPADSVRYEKVDQTLLLAALPPRQRTALLLYTVKGWAYGEIAALEDISIKAARQLVVRARKTSGVQPGDGKEPGRRSYFRSLSWFERWATEGPRLAPIYRTGQTRKPAGHKDSFPPQCDRPRLGAEEIRGYFHVTPPSRDFQNTFPVK